VRVRGRRPIVLAQAHDDEEEDENEEENGLGGGKD
jgi:hypothetical protein